jgi:periplasmic protein TonB
MLILGFGLLVPGILPAQTSAAPTQWQSLRILESCDPVYPLRLLQLAVTEGEARVTISVDSAGTLTEWLVTGYTQPEFADSAVAAIKEWKYEPARLNGRPVGVTSELTFHFTAQGVVISSPNLVETIEAQTLRLFAGRYKFRTCMPQDLDRAPTPIATVSPAYPRDLAQKGVRGAVEVEFYIDPSGAVRLPSLAPGENVELGGLAIAALSQWKFSPPTSHGRAVLVKAVQEFNFRDGG